MECFSDDTVVSHAKLPEKYSRAMKGGPMKPVKIRVSYGETIQPVKFEALRVGYEVELELDEEEAENALDLLDATRETLKRKVKAAIKADTKEW
jgi:hypothetical protein